MHRSRRHLGLSPGAIGSLLAILAVAATAAERAAPQVSHLGETIATHGIAPGVAACIGCHGAKGQGNAAAGFPRLAGISAVYLATQLDAFAIGARRNPIMQPLAKAMTPADRAAVAEYFSQLPSTVAVLSIDDTVIKPSDAGAWLANRGRWKDELPACAECHGSDGLGSGTTFPPLAGQPADYIARQLHAWKTGTRPPGPMALMSVVTSKLSNPDIAAVSAYYAGLGGGVAAADKGESQ